MEEFKTYFAFISYQRQDEEWAKWLAHELEHYHFPTTLNGHPNVPKDLRPIFRDIDELSAGNLPSQIHKALSNSKHLIVICSPRSAQSKWVNKEIEEYISLGRINSIFPFIIDGKAYSENFDEECFPPALRNLPKEDERLGGNISELGRDAAVVKIVAGMLDLEFDTLWQRYEREKAEEERKIREQRDKLLIIQSRYLAEKSQSIASTDSYTARLLALEALPISLDSPDRPFVAEAEAALRRACSSNSCLIRYDANCVSFSPDGYKIVTASDDCTVRIWDIYSGTEVRKFVGHKEKVLIALYTPDGKNIISTSRDGSIIIWDAVEGDVRHILIDHKTRETCFYEFQGVKHVPWASSLSIRKDGKVLASGDGLSKNMCLWDIQRGTLLKRFIFPCPVNIVRFSPSGDRIAIVGSFIGQKEKIYIMDVTTGKVLKSIESMSAVTNSLEFSPDGKILIGNSNGSKRDNITSSIRFWDTESGQLVHNIENIPTNLSHVQYSPNGEYIVSAPSYHVHSDSYDFTLKVYDAQTYKLQKKLVGNQDDIVSLSINSHSNKIASCSKDKTLRIWELNKTELEGMLSNDNTVINAACYSPSQNYIACGCNNGVVSVWDAKTHVKVKTLIKDNDYPFTCVTYSKDGRFIAAASTDQKAYVWDSESFVLLHVLQGHTDEINTVSFSLDGARLVTASTDGTIRVWDANKGVNLLSFEEQEGTVTNAWFSPNGKYIISASEDPFFCIWNSYSGEILYKVETAEDCNCISYSPDGSLIASGSDNVIEIWDVRDYSMLRKIAAKGQDIDSIIFSPDGRYLVSVDVLDNNIKVWDVVSGIMVQSYICSIPTLVYNTVSFSPDGSHIITAGNQGAYIWSFPTLQWLITQSRNRFRDYQIPEEEKEKYMLK